DSYDGRPSAHQLRQQFVVEFAAKFGVLIGGPLVQQQNRPLFQHSDDERQAFALSVRQVKGSKFAIGEAGLLNQAKLSQQAGKLGRIGIVYPVEPAKEVIVGEDGRDQCTVFVTTIRGDAHTVER